MNRRLKVFGLAVAAVLVMGVAVVSSASAHAGKFTAKVGKEETAKVSGGQVGTDTFTVGPLPPLTCKTATVKGNALTPGPESTEVTLEPTYEECHIVLAGITKLATVTMNGCAYKFNATKETNGVPFSADTTIECPKKEEVTQKIEIHIYNSATSEAETLCTFDVAEQGPLTGITLDNKINTPTSADDVLATIDVTVAVHNTILKLPCPLNTNETATYKGEDTLQATDAAGKPVDASVS